MTQMSVLPRAVVPVTDPPAVLTRAATELIGVGQAFDQTFFYRLGTMICRG
jgi:hypothetical protein